MSLSYLEDLPSHCLKTGGFGEGRGGEGKGERGKGRGEGKGERGVGGYDTRVTDVDLTWERLRKQSGSGREGSALYT